MGTGRQVGEVGCENVSKGPLNGEFPVTKTVGKRRFPDNPRQAKVVLSLYGDKRTTVDLSVLTGTHVRTIRTWLNLLRAGGLADNKMSWTNGGKVSMWRCMDRARWRRLLVPRAKQIIDRLRKHGVGSGRKASMGKELCGGIEL